MYATILKCGHIVAGADEGLLEVEVIGGRAEKDTRDVLHGGGGLGQEKPEEATEETAGDEAEAD